MIRFDFQTVRDDPGAAAQIRQTLEAGGVVVFPTETVYGVGALAGSRAGIDKVRKLKGLDETAPLALHLPDAQDALNLLAGQHPSVLRFAGKVWPGPVALLLGMDMSAQVRSKAPSVDGMSAPVLIRVPDDAAAQWLLRAAGAPILAVAAGAEDADEAAKRWEGKADILIDNGRTRYGKPSTVVQVEAGKPPVNASAAARARPVFKVTSPGVFDARYIHKLLRYTLLLVCSGNTCRSPMAAGMAKVMLAQMLGLPLNELETAGVRVMSAGTGADVGAPASINAVSVMAEHGVDISKHRATQLTYDQIVDADMILCMTRSHMAQVLKIAPRAHDKTFLLDANHNDIQDPFGGTHQVYAQSAEQIRAGLETWLNNVF